MQIIVLGAHRSGTSLVTRLINMMGAYFAMGDTSIGANVENPKGFWERSDVIEANDDVLEHYGCEWDKLKDWPFPETIAKKDATALKSTSEKIKNIVLDLDANRPWVLKDPRLCLTYPHWKQHLEVPVMVCVYRNPQEIARSLKTRNEFSFSHSMALWEYYATGITNVIRNTPTVYVSHADLLASPVETVQKLFDELKPYVARGLEMPTEREITSFIDPRLYRSKGSERAMTDMVTEYQKRLIGYISGKEQPPTPAQKPTELSTDLIASLARFRSLQQKMEEQNQRFSDALQQNHELEGRLDSIHYDNDNVKQHYEELIHKEKSELEFLKKSASWRIGHGIVKFLRTISFQQDKQAL